MLTRCCCGACFHAIDDFRHVWYDVDTRFWFTPLPRRFHLFAIFAAFDAAIFFSIYHHADYFAALWLFTLLSFFFTLMPLRRLLLRYADYWYCWFLLSSMFLPDGASHFFAMPLSCYCCASADSFSDAALHYFSFSHDFIFVIADFRALSLLSIFMISVDFVTPLFIFARYFLLLAFRHCRHAAFAITSLADIAWFYHMVDFRRFHWCFDWCHFWCWVLMLFDAFWLRFRCASHIRWWCLLCYCFRWLFLIIFAFFCFRLISLRLRCRLHAADTLRWWFSLLLLLIFCHWFSLLFFRLFLSLPWYAAMITPLIFAIPIFALLADCWYFWYLLLYAFHAAFFLSSCLFHFLHVVLFYLPWCLRWCWCWLFDSSMFWFSDFLHIRFSPLFFLSLSPLMPLFFFFLLLTPLHFRFFCIMTLMLIAADAAPPYAGMLIFDVIDDWLFHTRHWLFSLLLLSLFDYFSSLSAILPMLICPCRCCWWFYFLSFDLSLRWLRWLRHFRCFLSPFSADDCHTFIIFSLLFWFLDADDTPLRHAALFECHWLLLIMLLSFCWCFSLYYCHYICITILMPFSFISFIDALIAFRFRYVTPYYYWLIIYFRLFITLPCCCSLSITRWTIIFAAFYVFDDAARLLRAFHWCCRCFACWCRHYMMIAAAYVFRFSSADDFFRLFRCFDADSFSLPLFFRWRDTLITCFRYCWYAAAAIRWCCCFDYFSIDFADADAMLPCALSLLYITAIFVIRYVTAFISHWLFSPCWFSLSMPYAITPLSMFHFFFDDISMPLLLLWRFLYDDISCLLRHYYCHWYADFFWCHYFRHTLFHWFSSDYWWCFSLRFRAFAADAAFSADDSLCAPYAMLRYMLILIYMLLRCFHMMLTLLLRWEGHHYAMLFFSFFSLYYWLLCAIFAARQTQRAADVDAMRYAILRHYAAIAIADDDYFLFASDDYWCWWLSPLRHADFAFIISFSLSHFISFRYFHFWLRFDAAWFTLMMLMPLLMMLLFAFCFADDYFRIQ